MIFKLNMQILYDAVQEAYPGQVRLFGPELDGLEDVRLYRTGAALNPRYVYVLDRREMDHSLFLLSGIPLILCGASDGRPLPSACTVLETSASLPLAELFSLVQDVFERFHTWDKNLDQALLAPYPLDAMLTASLPVFRNPVFVHDPNFFILSCPRHIPEMPQWERDARSGWDIVPLSLIHDFKADPEYLHTLTTRKASLFSADQRGYPILYVNLWNREHYEGRICVDELETPILPGQYSALQYLGERIQQAMQNRSVFQLNMGNDLDQFFREFLEEEASESSRAMQFLYFLNWRQKDRYLCLRLETKQKAVQMLSTAATLSHIETQVPTGHAFLHQNGITVVVNLSYSHSRISDIISSLAVLLREGLLKMGASSELRDFFELPQGYIQASMALELGQRSPSMSWCYRFDEYLLDFLMEQGTKCLSPRLLCSHKLILLKEYDEKNHTDFYGTLKLFLELERNILQTSRGLFIHRSTLLYRLDRIRKIADVNLDDEKERLVLRISFYVLEQSEAR